MRILKGDRAEAGEGLLIETMTREFWGIAKRRGNCGAASPGSPDLEMGERERAAREREKDKERKGIEKGSFFSHALPLERSVTACWRGFLRGEKAKNRWQQIGKNVRENPKGMKKWKEGKPDGKSVYSKISIFNGLMYFYPPMSMKCLKIYF